MLKEKNAQKREERFRIWGAKKDSHTKLDSKRI